MLTTITAIFGAISGVLSLSWLIRNWRLDRADVRLRVAVSRRIVAGWAPSPRGGRMLDAKTKPILAVTLVNHGRRDAQVDSMGADASDGTELTFANTGKTIVKAETSETFELPVDVFAIEEPRVTALFARGALGQRWELPYADFVDVRGTAHHVLADASKAALGEGETES